MAECCENTCTGACISGPRDPVRHATVRIGYLRAALQRLRDGEFRSSQVMADVAKAALDLDDTLA